MLAPTHAITTALIVSVPLCFGVENDNYMVLIFISIIGTVLPDRIESLLVLKHREISHNIIIPIVFIVILIGLKAYYLPVLIVGYLLHNIMDSASIGGVKNAFYPLQKRGKTFFLLPFELRYKVGGKAEVLILFVSSILLAINLLYNAL